jgi:hypothetical protein
MRILVFAALLGSGLCAQTPPVKPFEPSPEPQAAIPVQPSNPAGNRRFFSLPTPMIVTPNNMGGRVWPGIVPNVFGHVTLAPGRACAIPLLNVVPKSGFHGDPKIAIMGPQTLANIDHMPLIQAVPVCPQGQR